MSFDHFPERRHTGSLKWDKFPKKDPYWVADMDFPSPEPVVAALINRAQHRIFGYAWPKPSFVAVLEKYLLQQHGVENVDSSWFVHLPGCVPALSTACRMACNPGDEVLTCTPVYPPFLHVHDDARAKLLTVPHVWTGNRWEFDREALEATVTKCTKIFLLSNPQNPLGRVFTEEEILWLAEFCERHDLILCSDEIHCDLVLDSSLKHYTALNLPENLRNRLIVLMAPSKTYNIAGLAYSFATIPNEALRQKFIAAKGCTMAEVNVMGYAAAEAAYEHGALWRKQLISTLKGNRDALYDFAKENLPKIKLFPMEATYLAWMDCSALNLENPQEFFSEQAGIELSSGAPFGSPQHVRFNFGTSRQYMMQGLSKMAKALESL